VPILINNALSIGYLKNGTKKLELYGKARRKGATRKTCVGG
jgi:hypothetical protein